MIVVGHVLGVHVLSDAKLCLEAANALGHLVRSFNGQSVALVLFSVHDAKVVVGSLRLGPDVCMQATCLVLKRLVCALENALSQPRCRCLRTLLPALLIQIELHLSELVCRWHVIWEANKDRFLEGFSSRRLCLSCQLHYSERGRLFLTHSKFILLKLQTL